jgi:hypothetical protein
MFLSLSLRAAIFWVAAIVCVAAELAILRSTFRVSRAALAPDGEHAATVAPRGRPAVEIVWAVLPAIALVVALIFTREAMR